MMMIINRKSKKNVVLIRFQIYIGWRELTKEYLKSKVIMIMRNELNNLRPTKRKKPVVCMIVGHVLQFMIGIFLFFVAKLMCFCFAFFFPLSMVMNCGFVI